MINFKNDYCGIAHPRVLKKLLDNVNNTYIGYGLDEESSKAKELIKNTFSLKDVDIHFLPGGTITNKIMIATSLRPFEAVISVDSGHINVHETGAIEATGHKVLTINGKNGKVDPLDVIRVFDLHTDEHMVKPKMLYISNPTEFGTLYTLDELKMLSKICKEKNMYLYIDGARLGVALTADKNDIKPSDYAKYADAFYIGGVKNGLIMGEALVIVNDNLKKDFRYYIKHYGGMTAKGFVNGLQFIALFEDDLFFEIGKYQNHLATILATGLKKLNVEFLMEHETNQIFIILSNDVIDKLANKLLFEIWEKGDRSSSIRLVTNYLLKEKDILDALSYLEDILNNR